MSSAAWTAVGTIFLAVVTLAAILTTIILTRQDRKDADRRLAEASGQADDRLQKQQEHSDEQLREERQHAQEQEQFAEAYLVQVVMGEKMEPENIGPGGTGDALLRRLAVAVCNRGKYTITRVEAQFSVDGQGLTPPDRSERPSAFSELPAPLQEGWSRLQREAAMQRVLTPWDVGLRFETDRMHVKFLTMPYAIVRWTDRWGIRWEHKKGEVRQIDESEQWIP